MTIRALLRNNGALITLGIALSLLSTAATLLLPALVSRLLTNVGSGDFQKPLILLLAALSATSLFTASTMYVTSVAADRAVRDMRKRITSHLLYLRMDEFEKGGPGSFTTRVTSDTSIVSTAFSSTLVDFVGGITIIIGSLVYMAVVDWRLLLVVVVVLSIALIIIVVVSSSLQGLSSKVQGHLATLGEILQSALSAFRTIKAFRSESKVVHDLALEIDHAYKYRRKMSFVEAVLDPLSAMASYIALITVALFGSIRLNSGDLTAETLTIFVTALFLMLAPIVQVSQSVGTFFEAKGALDRINRIFELEIEDPIAQASESAPALSSGAPIEFNAVSFYRDGHTILDEVSLSIQAGEKVALTGASGSGKTTIFSLLLSFYDASTGRILLGGTDLQAWQTQALRTVVAYVEQEPDLLPGTLRDNLLLGVREAPAEGALIRFLRQFGLEKFASAEGLDRMVGTGNSGLSGGERQRVAIIRAVLQKAPVLLVDEPTSALDLASAKLVMSALLDTEATVIFSSHDEDVANLAERVLVVTDGKLVEAGSADKEMSYE